jgi:CRISPR-associated protein Csm3
MPWTLKRYAEVRGRIHCLTGLHIGGGKDDIEIGGMDNPVIRHPVTRLPYLPGSSLKGKTRSLLEYCYGRVPASGQPCGCAEPDCPVCTLFGPHFKPNHSLGPSRLIFRDAPLTAASQERLRGLQEAGLDFAEVKTSTRIDRLTQIAARGALRSEERVPDGSEFDLTISVRLFVEDDEERLLRWLGEGLALLQKDTLGGSGTRGSGWVKLDDLTKDGKVWSLPEPRCGAAEATPPSA